MSHPAERVLIRFSTWLNARIEESQAEVDRAKKNYESLRGRDWGDLQNVAIAEAPLNQYKKMAHQLTLYALEAGLTVSIGNQDTIKKEQS